MLDATRRLVSRGQIPGAVRLGREWRVYHELIAYASYLAKDGKGDGEDAGVHVTRDGVIPDIPAFLSRLWKVRWCFKVILSPAFAQSWMQQVEADLSVKLDWIDAVYRDT
jgi:hypothetical protein